MHIIYHYFKFLNSRMCQKQIKTRYVKRLAQKRFLNGIKSARLHTILRADLGLCARLCKQNFRARWCNDAPMRGGNRAFRQIQLECFASTFHSTHGKTYYKIEDSYKKLLRRQIILEEWHKRSVP